METEKFFFKLILSTYLLLIVPCYSLVYAEELQTVNNTQELTISDSNEKESSSVKGQTECVVDYNTADTITHYYTDGTFQYKINPDGKSLSVSGLVDRNKIYNGLSIPSSFYLYDYGFELPVNTISYGAFSSCINILGTLNLPNSIQYIEGMAFYGCKGLSGKLTLPNGLISLASFSFGDCTGLNEIIIPASVVTMDESAFSMSNNISKITNNSNQGIEASTLLNYGEVFVNQAGRVFKGSDLLRYGVYNKGIDINGISLNKKEASIHKGKKIRLKATITPSNASFKKITWKSSNERVATVNQSGVVKGKSKGTATITATTQNGKKAKCKIKVLIPVKGVKLNKTKVTIEQDDTVTLKATIKPKNASIKEVSWRSTNEDVAEVDSDGEVEALEPGKCTIIVTTKDGKYKAKCRVTVIEESE